MEPKIQISSHRVANYRPNLEEGPVAYFNKAWLFTQRFYKNEYQTIADTKFETITPEMFFREYVWVVHATGFNARVVASMMPKLIAVYEPFRNTVALNFEDLYEKRVKPICAHRGKSKAIWDTARLLQRGADSDWGGFKFHKLSTPERLQQLSFIGPITCFHLARNIGLLEFVKPDLHLVRLSEYWGLKDSTEMCKVMRGSKSIPLGLVDLAVWYLASTFGTLEAKKEGER